MKLLLALILTFVSCWVQAAPISLAITIDDLPVHGSLPPNKTRLAIAKQMLATFKKHSLKQVYGFVNGEAVARQPDLWAVLKIWVDSGQKLGNHTFGHININDVDTNTYIQQIKTNETYLTDHMFRYPYLYEGNTQAKRDAVRGYLFKHHYQIAQVTTDFEDYLWNDAYVRCLAKNDVRSIAWLKKSYIDEALKSVEVAHIQSKLLFNRDVKQILLLHIGVFDAYMLESLLTTYKKHGIIFISLQNALRDKAYKINPNVVSNNSGTFLNQLQAAKKIKAPAVVENFIPSIPEEKLDRLCE